MSISVALATYNGSTYLLEQLDSIAAQTLLPVELVVSDDGSSDDTLSIVRAFSETAPFPVRILDKDRNLGFGDNFLFCASQCKGDLIAFCDQDDVWLPEKLAVAFERIKHDESLSALHTLALVDENLKPTKGGIWKQDIPKDCVIQPQQIFPWAAWGNTLLFKREILDWFPYSRRPKHPEKDMKLSHDTWIYILSCALGKVSQIDNPLILYRQHGKNESQTKKRTFIEKWMMKHRLSMVPLHQRMVFYRDLSFVFAEIADQHNPRTEFLASEAAIKYSDMSLDIKERTDIYYNRSIGERLKSFRIRLLGGNTRLSEALKDAILGVSGIHKAIYLEA
ncbi:glycosyltransferase family 2 protein [Acetobacter sicerae]|uniref:glycosyltransferase family 2 protein n=1 Tax=Acetobacter sicerae TaxID=85325 RepID=UPI00156B7D1D|nr:glycosyltransferase family 2 protein [Acetobacter sicerae]NHN93814.1 glycosyltransferase [Acetobacter sicerae]